MLFKIIRKIYGNRKFLKNNKRQYGKKYGGQKYKVSYRPDYNKTIRKK